MATIIAPVVVPPNTLDLLGRRVRYRGKEGLVASRFNPLAAYGYRLAQLRGESVTIRIDAHSTDAARKTDTWSPRHCGSATLSSPRLAWNHLRG